MDEIPARFRLCRRIARNRTQGSVITPAKNGILVVVVVRIDCPGSDIVSQCGAAGEIDLIQNRLLHRNMFRNVIQIRTRVPVLFFNGEVKVKAGVLCEPAPENTVYHQSAALCHDRSRENHGDDCHNDTHGGEFGRKSTENQ